jgi:hypothetical protein
MTEPRKPTFSQSDGVHLKDYLERVVEDQKHYLEQKIAAVEKATIIAAEVLDKRLHTMNEIRASLEDARANSPTNSDLKTLQKQVDAMDKRMSEYLTVKEFASIKQVIDGDVRELRESKANLAGKANQGTVMLSVGLACISLLLSAIGAISTALNLMKWSP